ncbi:uncharacterized protein [Drosophila virilis]|uniref:UBA domain-containing protein n=1 Tax=Drosophila virilis TaxID=7244 RepID=B4MD75_DROVI|nr:uncharacterized protein LOC6635488 [Drosophila virilis]EDW58147.2 uncharacterized protein Dvir_GJ15374 [Drosophila virilis]
MPTNMQNEQNAAETDVSTDANDTVNLIKLVADMGYPENEARDALERASNNLELAIQYLVEGSANSDEEQLSDAALRRRTRRRHKQLRNCLMDNPAITDYAVAALMKQPPRAVEALRDIVANHSVLFLESMLESSSDEEQPKLAAKSAVNARCTRKTEH